MIFIFTRYWRSIKVCPLVKLLLVLLCLHKKICGIISLHGKDMYQMHGHFWTMTKMLYLECVSNNGFILLSECKIHWYYCQVPSKSVFCFNFHINNITCNTWFQVLTSALVSFMLLSGNTIFTTYKSFVSTYSLHCALWSVILYWPLLMSVMKAQHQVSGMVICGLCLSFFSAFLWSVGGDTSPAESVCF